MVDDEPAVHQVTRLALRNFVALGRPSELINALSAADAREQLRQHPDIALALLDVVMETDTAGLDLVRYIREDLGNHLLRIVLRTGQPGQAPERTVMLNYDINDYKEKTELTSNKLFTTVLASLRTYHHVASLARLRLGVEVLGRLSTEVFAAPDLVQLARTLVDRFYDLGMCISVACQGPDGSDLAPGSAAAQAALVATTASAQPGTLLQSPGQAGLCLVTGGGERLVLGLELPAELSEQDAHVLGLMAQSTAALVARWPARP